MAIFNFKPNILLEAEKEVVEVQEDEGTDYTAEVPEDTDTDDTTEEETPEEDAPEDTDDTAEEEPTDEENPEETADETEPTDYTAELGDDTTDDGMGEGEETQEEQPQEEQVPDAVQNALLMKDMNNLYNGILNSINKLNNLGSTNIQINKICIQVKNNLTKLSEYIYDYITGPFTTNTYVKNLYVYNYALESIKINLEMLRNLKDFNLM